MEPGEGKSFVVIVFAEKNTWLFEQCEPFCLKEERMKQKVIQRICKGKVFDIVIVTSVLSFGSFKKILEKFLLVFFSFSVIQHFVHFLYCFECPLQRDGAYCVISKDCKRILLKE